MTHWKRRPAGALFAASAALLAGAALFAAPVPQLKDAGRASQLVMVDEFDGAFALNWRPVRPDPTHVSLTKNPGKLTITTQRGSIHGEEKIDDFGGGIQAKNIHVLDNPLAKGRDFVLTTSVVGFAPATSYQQAGLIVYDDDDNYLKWGCESNSQKPGGQCFTFVREVAAKPDHDPFDADAGLKRFWLRITKRGESYEYASSADGEKFTVHGEKEWGGAAKRVGLIAKNGGNKDAPEIDAAFEFFELRSPAPLAAGK